MKKTKIIILIAVIVIVLAGIIATTVYLDKKKDKAPENTVPEVKEAQIETLRILYSPYEPVIYQDGDKISGFDAELIAYVCDKMGISFEFKQSGFDEMKAALENDEADCIWTGYIVTNGNKDDYDFSTPYVTMEMDYGNTVVVEDWVVAVKKDRDDNLLELIEEALEKAKADGTIEKLAEKYELTLK